MKRFLTLVLLALAVAISSAHAAAASEGRKLTKSRVSKLQARLRSRTTGKQQRRAILAELMSLSEHLGSKHSQAQVKAAQASAAKRSRAAVRRSLREAATATAVEELLRRSLLTAGAEGSAGVEGSEALLEGSTTRRSLVEEGAATSEESMPEWEGSAARRTLFEEGSAGYEGSAARRSLFEEGSAGYEGSSMHRSLFEDSAAEGSAEGSAEGRRLFSVAAQEVVDKLMQEHAEGLNNDEAVQRVVRQIDALHHRLAAEQEE